MKPTIGRIVHYVLNEGKYPGQHRPAIIVGVWTSDLVQLQVFTDADTANCPGCNDALPCPMWKTSVKQDEDEKKPFSWHWPERDEE